MKLPNYDTMAPLSGDRGLPTATASAFFDAQQKWTKSNGGTRFGTSAQRTDETVRGYVDPGDLADGTFYVETDTGLVYQWRMSTIRFTTPSGSWVFVLGTVVTDQTLSAASTTIDPPAEGFDWAVILRQDATGGRAIVWGAGIIAASAAIDTTASTISTFRFVKTGSDWCMVGQPTTGMTP